MTTKKSYRLEPDRRSPYSLARMTCSKTGGVIDQRGSNCVGEHICSAARKNYCGCPAINFLADTYTPYLVWFFTGKERFFRCAAARKLTGSEGLELWAGDGVLALSVEDWEGDSRLYNVEMNKALFEIFQELD
mgnify:FL=1